MAERIPNRTRSALILLLITVIVVLVTLVADLMARIYLISMGQNEAEGFRGVEVFLMTCGFDALAMYIIYILLVVGISILFSARHAYGGLHARKIITSFVLTLIAPVVWFMFSFIFGIFMLRSFGIGPTMIIILFLIIIFLSTYELNGKRMGIFGLVIGILFALPLLALTNTVIQLGDKSEGLKHLASVFLVADIGLISSMTFFIISITKAMGYVSARPPRQEFDVADDQAEE